jgi:Tfp pilus assembly protein PilE
MKGIELPINVMIIVLIALVVLIAIIALFTGVWNPGSQSLSLESAKSSACQKLVSAQCSFETYDIVVNNYDADNDGKIDPGTSFSKCSDWTGSTDYDKCDNLYALCKKRLSISDNGCRQLCNC